MKRLIIDMDDVITDTTGQLIDFYHKAFGVRVTRESLSHQNEGVGFPANHEAIQRFPHQVDFFRSMIPQINSIQILEELNKKYDLYIVSAAVQFPQSMAEKVEWLGEHCSFLTWKQMVFCGSKAVVHGDFMIDDMHYNLETFNGEKFLFTAPHNLQYSQFQRLNNWDEVGARFL